MLYIFLNSTLLRPSDGGAVDYIHCISETG